MTSRDNILARLRAAPQTPPPPLPDVAGWFAGRRRSEDPAARTARLRAALEAAHTEVHDTTASGWPQLLLQIAATKKLASLLVGDGTPACAALSAQPSSALRLIRYARAVETFRDELFDGIDAGLTTAKSAIAETGSLILWPDAQEPRLMSLVPPVHFVLLDPATIHADFDAAMRAERWSAGLPTNVLLISGPSKTADIQQTLAYGAHGPRELIVLLCHAEGGVA
jgi:L-lactate dehydrogenase complex protein LldG